MYFFERFVKFGVEYSPNCQQDSHLITQNSNSAKLCGNELSIINSNGPSFKFEGFFNHHYYSVEDVYTEPIVNDIRIVLKTDGSSQKKGFSIEIKTSLTKAISGHLAYCTFL
ncbi:DgyrCDS14673 [Dimorphilus gyrociliatus]|uniref:DgyrCDS14673 n=1 Tax=Dimorphilus gyrociliatus TaxID=2664684 RepID=A0A7I8WEH9_9ANNE|nr:DgyrCDS14673 [Dimorphilus gyrociliatus]